MTPTTDQRGAEGRPTPDDEEKLLAALDRPQRGDAAGSPCQRIKLRRKTFEGRPFFDLRLAVRTMTGEYAYSPKGVSIRLHEAPEVIAGLWSELDAKGRERVRQLLADPAAEPAQHGGDR